jgi:hypothetical protein
MGGGGALIAAQRTPTLKAAISMAGWNPAGQYRSMRVPTLMFAGTADPLAGGQSQGFYRSIPAATPKMLYEVRGGSHSVANSPRGHGGKVGLFGLSWLKTYLEGDTRYKQFLTQRPTGLSTFTTNVSSAPVSGAPPAEGEEAPTTPEAPPAPEAEAAPAPQAEAAP